MAPRTTKRPAWIGTLVGVAQNVGLPIASYLLLTGLGVSPVWALAGSAGVSVAVLAIEWIRGHGLNALGALVLARFGLSLALAWFTGDARVLLVKDGAITLTLALVALTSLTWQRPLITRVRADLSGDPDAFHHQLTTQPVLARLHRRLTLTWAVGLSLEAALSIAVALVLPVTAAVVITNLTGPAAIISLVAWTEWSARTLTSRTTSTANAV